MADETPRKFVLLTRLVSEEVHPSSSIEDKAHVVQEKIREYCPSVNWIDNLAILGPWDYLDIFEAPDTETAIQVGALVRTYGGAHTEIWPAVEWQDFKQAMRGVTEMREGNA
jgi:uncharacterized protein with GYD domain